MQLLRSWNWVVQDVRTSDTPPPPPPLPPHSMFLTEVTSMPSPASFRCSALNPEGPVAVPCLDELWSMFESSKVKSQRLFQLGSLEPWEMQCKADKEIYIWKQETQSQNRQINHLSLSLFKEKNTKSQDLSRCLVTTLLTMWDTIDLMIFLRGLTQSLASWRHATVDVASGWRLRIRCFIQFMNFPVSEFVFIAQGYQNNFIHTWTLYPFDGQVGLLTGFSVLSMMELLYHLGLLATAISTRGWLIWSLLVSRQINWNWEIIFLPWID